MHDLYDKIGYSFKDESLLKQALTHPSIDHDVSRRGNEPTPNYERLEFLGDTVLALIITEMLLKQHPDEPEGLLAKRRGALVSGSTLSQIAVDLGLGSYLIMAESEATSGGRSNKNNLENALEALIGAFYLDSNDLKQVALFVEKHWLPLILSMEAPPKDPKSTLQEWSQKLGKPIPAYNLIATTGLAHAPSFKVEVVVKGLPPISQTGPSKKVAERLAAIKMLEYIKNHGIKG